MTILDTLNDKQKQAAKITDNALVIAGPGTGKTRVIIAHIYDLVANHNRAIFACDDMCLLFRYIRAMFGSGVAISNDISVYYWYTHSILLLVLFVASLEWPSRMAAKLCRRLSVLTEGGIFVLKGVYTVIILILCVAFLVRGSYNPFLYFRF